MTSLLRIFSLELTALIRSWTAAILLALSLGWLFLADRFLVTDATAEGHREMVVRYGLGGVFALLVVALLAAGTGAIASEREAKRLQLTQVRPVSGFAIAWGKFLALSVVGAAVLAVSCATVALSQEFRGRTCSHVLRPQMITPREEAEKTYDFYMNDPDTPPQVKKAKKSVVLRILEQRAKDNYQTVQTNETAVWDFPGLSEWTAAHPDADLSVRFRFSNTFNMRDDVRGAIAAPGFSASVSNITQTAIVIPLARGGAGCEKDVLKFTNGGRAAVMLRPRQDVELLVPADAFGWNMIRAFVVMTSVIALVIAFGIFLGAGLSRPVALFTAITLLAVSEMSPSVIDQYPDQLESDRIDSVGLAITRAVDRATKSVSSVSPLSSVAQDDCVESEDAAGLFALDFILLPILLSMLSAFLIRRKQEQ